MVKKIPNIVVVPLQFTHSWGEEPTARSSRSQIFYVINVIIKRRLQHRCFPVNIAKF